ncbi:MAG: class I mannose-6-phosphate isomerase [Lachnospiraceae bacterium]|nr:class I mannose-6-phosphate isomerase [Lachnospiraceae bacterium]
MQPILLRPIGKDYLWGGNRLREEYGKDLLQVPLAETWECSTHPDGPSVVVSGSYQGMGLDEVLQKHPEWLGSRYEGKDELPILIKFIDAAKDLSVQVHPDDEYALEREKQLGKTEMWYVLDAKPGAKLVYGFAHDVTSKQVRESLQDGSLGDYLQQIPVKKNDVFFVKPGTVHAIGEGVLIAEIQENSNVTYRVYDYDRVDKNGQKRPLHVDKALEVMNLKRADAPRQNLRLMRYQPGSAEEILCRCQYFQVNRVLVSSEYRLRVETTSFQVLLVLEGEMNVKNAAFPDNDGIFARKGDCLLLPADCGEVQVSGKGQLLRVFC